MLDAFAAASKGIVGQHRHDGGDVVAARSPDRNPRSGAHDEISLPAQG
jgi:hypothetical protein